MTRPRTCELKVGARLFRTKVTLIRAVAAIVLRVALPDIRNASTVLAGELRRSAGDICAFKFIRMIAAVVLLIASEILRNTATRFALEFVAAARRFCEKMQNENSKINDDH